MKTTVLAFGPGRWDDFIRYMSVNLRRTFTLCCFYYPLYALGGLLPMLPTPTLIGFILSWAKLFARSQMGPRAGAGMPIVENH